ncbi:MAG: hypothetical protein AAGB51_10335 [Planctomycetota bacterium]
MQQYWAAILVSFLAASAAAQPIVPVTYQGVLERNGARVTGQYVFRVEVFGSASGTDSVAGPYDIAGTAVEDGLFALTFDLDTAGLDSTTYWLEISVGRVRDTTLEVLGLRQAFNPSALSVQSAGAEIEPDGTNVLGRGEADLLIVDNLQSGTSSATKATAWQSFVPDVGGRLSLVSFGGDFLSGNTITVNIFEGRGVGGTLVLSEGGGFDTGGIFLLPFADLTLIEGQEYTAQVIIEGLLGVNPAFEFGIVDGDPYPQGESSEGFGRDLRFSIGVRAPGQPAVQVLSGGRLQARQGIDITGRLVVSEDPDLIGLDTVLLPDNSIDPIETSAEPGVSATRRESTLIETALPSSLIRVAEAAMTPPANGYIHATYTAVFKPQSVPSLPIELVLEMNGFGPAISGSYVFPVTIRESNVLDLAKTIVTIQGVFEIDLDGLEGTSTEVRVFATRLDASFPTAVASDSVLTLIYYPTSYGVVESGG